MRLAPDGAVDQPHSHVKRQGAILVRAVPARSERIRDAAERAYAAKYNTPGSLKCVRGFRTRRRRDATLELRPGAGLIRIGGHFSWGDTMFRPMADTPKRRPVAVLVASTLRG
jgi:hypothetical protein